MKTKIEVVLFNLFIIVLLAPTLLIFNDNDKFYINIIGLLYIAILVFSVYFLLRKRETFKTRSYFFEEIARREFPCIMSQERFEDVEIEGVEVDPVTGLEIEYEMKISINSNYSKPEHDYFSGTGWAGGWLIESLDVSGSWAIPEKKEKGDIYFEKIRL